MSRKVNEDKLCTAFYQCMDFLNFDQKKYERFMHTLASNNLSGWLSLQNAIATNNADSFAKILNELIRSNSKGVYNVSLGKKVYLDKILNWLNYYNTNELNKVKFKKKIL